MTSSLQHWPSDFPHRPGGRADRGVGGAVASTDRLATDAGLDVLAEGGNALDAAVAVAFALAVVNPEAGNLGGGGFFLIRTADGRVHAQDHRSTAPGAARPEMFWEDDGGVSEDSVVGHRAVAVPGSVRGLWEAHARFGHLDWARLVEPAIGLADGFEIQPRFLASLPPHIVDGLARFPTSAGLFLVDGKAPPRGHVLRQPDLADSLRRIRAGGADGFYRGPTADRIVEEMRSGGGLISHADLAGYGAVWRSPVRFAYRGHTVWSMPPSSSGGVTLAGAAHALAGRALNEFDWHGPDHLHWIVEAWRRAFADRNHWLGDPDRVEVPLDRLLSPGYGAARGASIDPGGASRSVDVGPGDLEGSRGRWRDDGAGRASSDSAGPATRRPGTAPREGRHTTHVSTVDADGMAVSLTTTLNTWYGSKLVAAGTGILLNNEMDDFTTRPGVPNFFGLVQGTANQIAPGKRMLSAMTPTMVTRPDGRLRLVVGSPGGATIITTVFQVVSNMLDFGMGLADATAAPRIHHQHMPDRIDVEPGGLPPSVIGALEALGHEVRVGEESWGDVEAVEVHDDGTLEAVADPRRGGSAGVNRG